MSENTSDISAKDQAKRLWSGIGSFLSSVKQKTLDIVDNLQDHITDIDGQLLQPQAPVDSQDKKDSKKEFDKKLLPTLENVSTYIDEPTQTEFQDYLNIFNVDDHKEDIELFMENSPNLRRIHSRLVPSAFPENVFWCRLFFKLEMKEKAKKVSEELKNHLSAENSPMKVPRNSHNENAEESLDETNGNADNSSNGKRDVVNSNEDDKNPANNRNSSVNPEDIDLTPEELEELDKLDNLGSDGDWGDWS